MSLSKPAKNLTRRTFNRLMGGLTVATAGQGLALGPAIAGGARPKAVIIGGGAAGATAAVYLARNFPDLDITLIEANPLYTACFFSSRYLGGFKPLDFITHEYGALKKYGIRVVHAFAAAIDAGKKSVLLKDGTRIPYDRLIAAPGIDFKFDQIEGYDETAAAVIPHAYKADAQIAVLRKQLLAMEDGGVFAIASPLRPYRCPPAPYERVSIVAHYLKTHKPKSKILILDSKDEFPMSEVMTDIWTRKYSDMVEWVPAEFSGHIKAVDVKTRTLISNEERYSVQVANVIPNQHAAKIAHISGLTDKSGWCPVDPMTFESALAPGVHMIGDAIDPGDMVKSAYSAHSQARACAAAVGAMLNGKSPAEAGLLGSTCFFLVSPESGVQLGGTYKSDGKRLTGQSGFISQAGEAPSIRRKTAEDGDAWYASIIKDMFG
ncbi:MAG: FAD-dependent oxidoreductase [Rhodospirillales bacterium]|nr:FAD-dependent oxidoreductase [Alphaproteobacteria bacterium]MBL6948206.1 FAD-dependent oxidoreductase [Rhodospirillales bacterium]